MPNTDGDTFAFCPNAFVGAWLEALKGEDPNTEVVEAVLKTEAVEVAGIDAKTDVFEVTAAFCFPKMLDFGAPPAAGVDVANTEGEAGVVALMGEPKLWLAPPNALGAAAAAKTDGFACPNPVLAVPLAGGTTLLPKAGA